MSSWKTRQNRHTAVTGHGRVRVWKFHYRTRTCHARDPKTVGLPVPVVSPTRALQSQLVWLTVVHRHANSTHPLTPPTPPPLTPAHALQPQLVWLTAVHRHANSTRPLTPPTPPPLTPTHTLQPQLVWPTVVASTCKLYTSLTTTHWPLLALPVWLAAVTTMLALERAQQRNWPLSCTVDSSGIVIFCHVY